MCEGLAYAHESRGEQGELLNVVHRDISPPNVLISEHGEIKIVDFGLAKASTQLEKSEAGIIKGKFSYLSPEAAHGHEVDGRTDIFAVGIILWEMLAGRRLFQGQTDYETVKQVQAAQVPAIASLCPDADDTLQSILNRALARDRDKRYGSARALGQDLSRYLYRLGRPVSAFDIAELVRGPMARRLQKSSNDQISIIDKLIQETLFEFTSLQDKTSGPQVGDRPSAEPFSLKSFEDFADWSDKAAAPSSEQANVLLRKTLTAEAFEEGNLAALEGPEEPARKKGKRPSAPAPDSVRSGRDSHVGREPSVPPSRRSITSMRPSAPPASVAPRSTTSGGSSTAVKALLLFVIAAGTAAAVWFSGLLQ